MKKDSFTAETPRTRKVTILGQEVSQREPTVLEAIRLQDMAVKIEFDESGNRSIRLDTAERARFIAKNFFAPSILIDSLPSREHYLEVMKAIEDWERWAGITAFPGPGAEENKPAGPAC